MERLPRGKYNREFRIEAVKLVIEGRLSAKEVGRRLKVSSNAISNWVGAHRQGKLTDVGKNNSPMESFWGTLKNELVHQKKYKTRKDAIEEITEYIEVFYNRQRRQATLGFLAPAAYEQQFHKERIAA